MDKRAEKMGGRALNAFVEKLFFRPGRKERIVSSILSPLSWLYGSAMWLRGKSARRQRYRVPVISVGNLVVGGTGKTPFVISLASRYPGAAVVAWGYGRKSRGTVVVSRKGRILCDVSRSGDEAMVMALSLPGADVIVSEDRHAGIRKALEGGASLILLDDGFNRVDIEKFEILLEPEKTGNKRVLPAGPFREFPSAGRSADIIVKEGREYERVVECDGAGKRLLLATAIARPERLDPWLPSNVVGKYILPDHAWFEKDDLLDAMRRYRADALLVTEKDAVKMEGFQLPTVLMRLKLRIDSSVFEAVERYLKEYYAT